MSKQAISTDEQRERLSNLIEAFDTAMLVTHDEQGQLRARPLSIADRDTDGALWFVTGQSSGKVFEIEEDSRVGVVLQQPSRFVSLTGKAELVADPERVRELWKEAWRPWFPGGPDDANIAALRVVVTQAEYWDLKGLNGLRYFTDAFASLVKGTRAPDNRTERYHAKTEPEAVAPTRDQ